jgi:hypothetical protein
MAIGLERDIVDHDTYDRTVERFREAGIRLPKISQLADPLGMKEEVSGLAERSLPASRPRSSSFWETASR